MTDHAEGYKTFSDSLVMGITELNWINPSETRFVAKYSNFGTKDCRFDFRRDADYQLELLISIPLPQWASVQTLLNKRKRFKLFGRNIRESVSFFSNQIYPHSTSHEHDCVKLTCSIIECSVFLRPKAAFPNKFTDHYFLNSMTNMVYPGTSRYDNTVTRLFSIQRFSHERYRFPEGQSLRWNTLLLIHNKVKIAIGALDDINGTCSSGTFIRCKGKDPVSPETIHSLKDYLSFLGGARLIPIGGSLISNHYTKHITKYISSLTVGIEHHLTQSPLIPFPYHSHEHNKDIEKLLSCGFKKYLSLEQDFELHKIIHLINNSRTSNFFYKVNQLATAYDLLKAKWFKSQFSRSKGKNLQDELYSAVISKYIEQIRSDLGKCKESTEPIINRILKANNLSLSEQDRAFFHELSIDYGHVEEFALNSRNSIVHGIHGTINHDTIRDANIAFQTLINRIILKLLGFEHYIDHTFPSGRIYRKIEDKMLGTGGRYTKKR